MAELTSAPASPVQPGTSGAAPQPPAVPPAPAAAPSVPPTSPATSPQINLHELPQFRQVQATYERQLAEERKKRQEAEMRGLDDFEKVQYEAQQLREQLATYEAQAREAALQAEKFDTLRTISGRTGVPIDSLLNATSPDEAWALAWDYRSQQMQAAAPPTPPPQAPAPQVPMNPWSQPTPMTPSIPAQAWMPDVGGTAAVNASERIEAEIADAQRKGDPIAYVRAIRQQQG